MNFDWNYLGQPFAYLGGNDGVDTTGLSYVFLGAPLLEGAAPVPPAGGVFISIIGRGPGMALAGRGGLVA